jgi:hypothetical protein
VGRRRLRRRIGPAVEATFTCSLCGATAGSLEVRGSATDAELRRETFTGVLTQRLSAGASGLLREALTEGDAGRVFALDPEFAPFYCPQCEDSYCARHWERWDVFDDDLPAWHDSIRGRCPQGHERMLED